ncbi:MAG: ABC transporter permease subunit [Planctomycetota bacterium]
MRSVALWFWKMAPANPMAVRIVAGGGRRPRHLAVRLAYLGLLILMLVLAFLFQGVSGGGSLDELSRAGASVLTVIAYAQVVLICVVAPVFMAGAIASEQSGKTYSILLATPMSGLQIVLGSLLGRLAFVYALLLSGLPLFAVLLLLGGAPASSAGASFAVAATTATFVGALAVAMSVLRAAGRKAVFGFVLVMVGYLAVVFAIDEFLVRPSARGTAWEGHTTWLTPLHPLLAVRSSLASTGYAPPPAELLAGLSGLVRWYLGRPVLAHVTLGWIASGVIVLASGVAVRWVEQATLGRARGRGLRGRLNLPAQAVSIGAKNPVAWREVRARGAGWPAWLLRYGVPVLAVLGAGALLLSYHFDPYWSRTAVTLSAEEPHQPFLRGLATLLTAEVVLVALLAAYLAAGSVSKEREDGTLDLLLTTPITPRQYVWGKLRGMLASLFAMLAAPVLTLAMLAVYTAVGAAQGWPQASYRVVSSQLGVVTQAPLIAFEAPVVAALSLAPFIALCVAVGMYWSVRSKGVFTALAGTLTVLGLIVGTIGLIGWGTRSLDVIGPGVNAASPLTQMLLATRPSELFEPFAGDEGQRRFARFTAGLGASIGALGFGLAVWSLLAGLVSGFDHTVRRLSGR